MAKFKTLQKRIEELADDNAAVRRGAAQQLGQFGNRRTVDSRRAVEPLCAALNDTDADVRRAAAKALGCLQDEAAFEPLRALLKDKLKGMRRAAAWSVGQIGKANPHLTQNAVESILQAAQKDRDSERWRYVQALTAMELTAVCPLCIEFNSYRSAATQDCARQALVFLEQHAHLDVVRYILAANSLTAPQQWNVLEMLGGARPTSLFANLHPTPRRFCEMVVASVQGCNSELCRQVCTKETGWRFRPPCMNLSRSRPPEAEAVIGGARSVLDYLSLGRASQSVDAYDPAQLLRMADLDAASDQDGATLLRGAHYKEELDEEEPDEADESSAPYRSIIGKLRRLLGLR